MRPHIDVDLLGISPDYELVEGCVAAHAECMVSLSRKYSSTACMQEVLGI